MTWVGELVQADWDGHPTLAPGVGNARREWARLLVSGIGHSPGAALPVRPDQPQR